MDDISSKLEPSLEEWENWLRRQEDHGTLDADLAIRKKLIDEHRILILSGIGALHLKPVPKTYMIRIHGYFSTLAPLLHEKEFAKVFEAQMEDIDIPETIDDDTAQGIVSFFGEIPKNHDLVAIHCRMGQCRSAAVAIAWARYKNEPAAEELIRSSGFHDPNPFVLERLAKYLPATACCSA